MARKYQTKSYFERKTGYRLDPMMQKLYEAVRDSGRTASDIADEAGIHTSVMSLWFGKGQKARLDTYLAVLNTLGLDFEFKEQS
jgi:DNA-binding phage protein